MKKQIHYAKVTLAVFMPVFCRTEAEAAEIAKECLGDFLSTRLTELEDEHVAVEFFEGQPAQIADDQMVWGESVPEEFSFVDCLRAHLEASL